MTLPRHWTFQIMLPAQHPTPRKASPINAICSLSFAHIATAFCFYTFRTSWFDIQAPVFYSAPSPFSSAIIYWDFLLLPATWVCLLKVPSNSHEATTRSNRHIVVGSA